MLQIMFKIQTKRSGFQMVGTIAVAIAKLNPSKIGPFSESARSENNNKVFQKFL